MLLHQYAKVGKVFRRPIPLTASASANFSSNSGEHNRIEFDAESGIMNSESLKY